MSTTDNVQPDSTQPSTSPTPIPEANDTYKTYDADFTIFSSDGMPFKVHKYQLMAASSVFRSMLSICDSGDSSAPDTSSPSDENAETSNNPPEGGSIDASPTSTNELKLTDPHIERCHTIRLFLDVIYGRITSPPTSAFHKYLNVGTLLKKYDCEAPMQAWKWALRAWSTDTKACTMTVFVCAANLDEIGTMVNLIATRSSTWAKMSEDDTDDKVLKEPDQGSGSGCNNRILKTAVTGNLVLDLTSARLDFFEAIPIVYSMGLLRASRIGSETGILDKKSRYKVSVEFEKIVKAGPKEPKTPESTEGA